MRIPEGCFYNLYDNGIETYLDPTGPWWSGLWIREAETGGRLYCITGSLALSLKRLMYVTYFNKNLAETLNLRENLYDVVQEGRWMIDYENNLAASVYTDLNGNSLRDEDDRYGLAINHYKCCDVYWSAFDMDFLAPKEDGWYSLAADPEKIFTAFEKVYYLIRENPGTYDTIDRGEATRKIFSTGQVLLASMQLRWVEHEGLRNMQDTYGIIPEPKFDEAQKQYYTYAHDSYTSFTVPVTAPDPECAGAVLNALCEESYYAVGHEYYDVALKGKYANDPESRRMLDLAVNGFVVDASFIYGPLLGQPQVEVFRGLIYDGRKNFASTFEKYNRVLPIALADLEQTISKLTY